MIDSLKYLNNMKNKQSLVERRSGLAVKFFPSFIFLICLVIPATLAVTFELEGSLTSYAQFRKWYAAQNGTLSLEIQTKDPNGLLLYTDDGGQGDFFELKLVEGSARLRYKLGGRADVITVRKNLQDSHWHRLEIIRNSEETSLRVDDETQSKVARGNFASFGGANYTGNGFVYVGGVPTSYGSMLSNLSLLSVFYEPRFRGSVQNVVFASEENQPSRKQDMIGFLGVRTNKLDACEHHVPCQHGGICVSTDSGAICNCREVDYDGSYCENEKPSAEATFRGSEYLSYDPLMKAPIIGSSDQVSLYFKSRQPSGMLFYTGDNEDYMMLSLRDGVIVLTVSLGSGSVEKAVRPAKVRFDDNQWHKVLVHRKVREITKAAGFCHFSITVDGVYTQRGSTAGTFSLLSSSVLFVGGSDKTSSNVGAKIRRNFVGCLRKVEFAADSLRFGVIEMARTGNKLIKANGNVKFMCQEVEAADPVTFTTRESFLALPSWQATRTGSLSFKIRTNEPNGVLMYNSGTNAQQGDFFAFEMLDGHIFLLLNFGSGSEKVKVSTRKVDDGHWHSISLRRTGKSGRVTVDESAVDFNTPGNSNQLDLDGPLYLGGIAATAEKATIPSELWTGLLGYGYIGCMRDLVVNGKVIDIAAHAEKQDSGSIRPACHTSPPQCDSQPCLNGGQCSEGWNRFICECTATSYSGTVCAKDATTLSFDGVQYMKIFIQEGSQTQAENIKLRFRTTRPNGLILITMSDKLSSYMLIALDSGKIRVTYNLVDGSKTCHVGQGLNDDQWHVFVLQRRGRFLEVKVDSETQTMELGKTHLNLDMNTIHIGAVTAERSNSATVSNPAKDLSSFVGHMQHLEMNGNHYFDMARTGQMSNFQVTAKFGKKDQIVHHPVTFKSKYTFIGMAQLKAYSSMNLYLQFKTLEANGVILYNAGKGQDFIAIEMVNGHLHYLFNLGDGPRKVRSNTRNTLNDNRWHAVTIGWTQRQHTLMVDDMIATVSSAGPNVHLDLDGLLYIGGVRRSMYATLPKLIQSRHGFEGCLASLDLNGEMLDPTKDAVIPSTLVSKGCAGPVTKCSNTACANRGVCVQMWNSYTCDCDMTSYTGPTCSDESIGYKFGPETGLITLTYPPDKRPDTKSDLLALAFYTHSSNAVLFRVDSGSSNDYMELEIADGNVFMVYNMGTEDHPIGEMSVRVNDGHYHVVRFTRSGPNSTIQVDDHNVRTKHPKGRQLTIFNSHSKIQVGGKKNPVRGKIERPFKGVITGLVFNGHRLLDMAAEDDPRVSLEGDVELLMQIPSDLMGKNNLSPAMQQHQRAPITSLVDSDELIHSGFGSGGCDDDEDDCGVLEPGSGDELITPVYIPPTPKPRPTNPPPPRQTMATRRPNNNNNNININVDRENRICDDEEDCIDGSGSGEQLPPSPTELINPNVIHLVTAIHIQDPKPSPQPTRPSPNVYSESNNNIVYPSGRDFTRRPAYVTTPATTVSTSRKPPQVYWVPNPDLSSSKDKESHKPSANTKSNPADNTALVIGIIAGIIIAIVLIALVVYIVRNRTVGSYKVDESKNYQFSAVTNSAPPVMTGQQAPPGGQQQAPPPQQMNGSVKPLENKANKLPKKKDVKDLKEWYV